MAVELAGAADITRCCGAMLLHEARAGVQVAACDACGRLVWRVNPRTAKAEWLNGAPFTTTADAAAIEAATEDRET